MAKVEFSTGIGAIVRRRAVENTLRELVAARALVVAQNPEPLSVEDRAELDRYLRVSWGHETRLRAELGE